MQHLVSAGHRDTFFRKLTNIRAGDLVSVTSREGQFRYVVEWTAVVHPEATEVLQPTPNPTLTLNACFPFNYIGGAPLRYIVRARQL